MEVVPSKNLPPVGQTGTQPSAKAGQGAPATSANTATAKNAHSAGVAVTVSNLARSLATAESGATSDVDTQKVSETRSAIQKGTYAVNPQAIADKLLANAEEMLRRTRT